MKNEKTYSDLVVVVGGINMDIHGFPDHKLILKDSNIGNVKLSSGGVGRNIAENISKLGIKTKLLSVLGGDIYGKSILQDAEGSLLDMKEVRIIDEATTSIYLCVMDEKRDMAVAINSMELIDAIDEGYLIEKSAVITDANLCVIDTNLPEKTISHLLQTYPEKKFFIDTVSTEKAMKIQGQIGYFHTIKPNRMEAEVLIGKEIQNEKTMNEAVEAFLDYGVEQVFITLGENGVLYGNVHQIGHLKSDKIEILNATGAGDAFTAALVYAHLKQMSIEETARFAMAASIVALSHENTINPDFSVNRIKQKMEALNYVEKIYSY